MFYDKEEGIVVKEKSELNLFYFLRVHFTVMNAIRLKSFICCIWVPNGTNLRYWANLARIQNYNLMFDLKRSQTICLFNIG